MSRPKVTVFASGSAKGGGSGFENLVLASRGRVYLDADVVAVVSNHENGGVRERADKLGVPFVHFPKPWTADEYQRIASESGADFFALSGWLKLVTGLDATTPFNSCTVFNIHPGPQRFGGPGLYGRRVHEAVLAAYKMGEITHSAMCMHFVTAEYDRGPVFFRCSVIIKKDDTPETLGDRVNRREHRFQPEITNLVINRQITWDGIAPSSLKVPPGYWIDIRG